jgi:PPOX class probable F420-dependent enzyme
MTEDELEQFLTDNLTVALVTINPDGTPLPTPLWYVNKGPTIYVATMRRLWKVKNILRDSRATAVVEDGDIYLKLRAAIVKGRAEIVEDEEELAWFNDQMAAKYDHRRPQMEKMAAATQRHYASAQVVMKLVPEKIWTWDNSKLRTGSSSQ